MKKRIIILILASFLAVTVKAQLTACAYTTCTPRIPFTNTDLLQIYGAILNTSSVSVSGCSLSTGSGSCVLSNSATLVDSKLQNGSADSGKFAVCTSTAGAWTWSTVAVTPQKQSIILACSDEITPLTDGQKISIRMPYGLNLSSVKASLNIGPSSGGTVFTVDVLRNSVSIFSTKITFDTGETTTATAAIPNVLSTSNLSDDNVITVVIDEIAGGGATGLKVYLIGTL